jgi:hypothetical protein
MSNIYYEKYLEYFNNFLKQLKISFPEEEIIIKINLIFEESDEQKINRGIFFNNLIDSEMFINFIDSKIKIFSHKDENTKNLSESLLGSELNLKKILNHQTNEIKNIIWTYLHVLYYNIEMSKEDKDIIKIKELDKLISNNKILSQNKVKNLLNLDVNDNTNNLSLIHI